jgi:hypothetical protein
VPFSHHKNAILASKKRHNRVSESLGFTELRSGSRPECWIASPAFRTTAGQRVIFDRPIGVRIDQPPDQISWRRLGYTEDPQATQRQAARLAEQALALAGDDPGVLANVALVLGDNGDAEISSAIALIDRSLALNPSSARACFISGMLRVRPFNGRPLIWLW